MSADQELAATGGGKRRGNPHRWAGAHRCGCRNAVAQDRPAFGEPRRKLNNPSTGARGACLLSPLEASST